MDDTIYRQAAIEALGERPIVWIDHDEYALGERNQYDMDRFAIETVPSAQPERCEDCRNFNKARLLIPQPERKKGKWIYLNGLDAFECSVCGRQMVRNIFDYCPWCGAEMTKGGNR